MLFHQTAVHLECCMQRPLLTFTNRDSDDENFFNRGIPGRSVRRGRVLADRAATSFDKYERHGYISYDRP